MFFSVLVLFQREYKISRLKYVIICTDTFKIFPITEEKGVKQAKATTIEKTGK